jgi:1-deoxy-D-xylulose-5-phosphate synthase
MLNKIIKKYKFIFTIEEGSISGGFGSSVLEYLSKNKLNVNTTLFGIDDNFVEHGTRNELLDIVGLSKDKLYKKIKDIYEK